MDPTPATQMRLTAPRVHMLIPRMDDCSGVAESAALAEPAGPLPSGVKGLLKLAGEVYLPFLKANAAALQSGEEEVALELLGMPYRQVAFRYQGKCYDWLRSEYRKLAGEARQRADAALTEAGCLSYLQ